jgi:hypothetical protein
MKPMELEKTAKGSDVLAKKAPSLARVLAGRANRLKRGPLTEEGRQRLRAAIHRDRPWEASTGPKSVAGKARVALNGKTRQTARYSVRENRKLLAHSRALFSRLAQLRNSLVAESDLY